MAISFNGTTDRIDYPNIVNSTAQALTISMWVYPTDYNRALQSRLFSFHVSGDTSEAFAFLLDSAGASVPGGIAMARIGTTTKNRRATTGVLTNNEWQHALLTDDGTLTASGAHIYRNGTEMGGYVDTNGLVEATGTGSVSIGGRINDDNRNFPGRIAEVGVWTVQLNADERAALAKAISPRYVRPQSLIFHAPLIRGVNDNRGKIGTVDGTTVIQHPRTYI